MAAFNKFNDFIEQLGLKQHDLNSDPLFVFLTNEAPLASDATRADIADLSTGGGYTAGGNTLTTPSISLDGSTAIVDFSDTTWSTSTITARGALIYNSSKSNKAIGVLDFGADKSSSTGDFVIVMPTANASTALIRIV